MRPHRQPPSYGAGIEHPSKLDRPLRGEYAITFRPSTDETLIEKPRHPSHVLLRVQLVGLRVHTPTPLRGDEGVSRWRSRCDPYLGTRHRRSKPPAMLDGHDGVCLVLNQEHRTWGYCPYNVNRTATTQRDAMEVLGAPQDRKDNKAGQAGRGANKVGGDGPSLRKRVRRHDGFEPRVPGRSVQDRLTTHREAQPAEAEPRMLGSEVVHRSDDVVRFRITERHTLRGRV